MLAASTHRSHRSLSFINHCTNQSSPIAAPSTRSLNCRSRLNIYCPRLEQTISLNMCSKCLSLSMLKMGKASFRLTKLSKTLLSTLSKKAAMLSLTPSGLVPASKMRRRETTSRRLWLQLPPLVRRDRLYLRNRCRSKVASTNTMSSRE